jgi:hypothetical protein
MEGATMEFELVHIPRAIADLDSAGLRVRGLHGVDMAPALMVRSAAAADAAVRVRGVYLDRVGSSPLAEDHVLDQLTERPLGLDQRAGGAVAVEHEIADHHAGDGSVDLDHRPSGRTHPQQPRRSAGAAGPQVGVRAAAAGPGEGDAVARARRGRGRVSDHDRLVDLIGVRIELDHAAGCQQGVDFALDVGEEGPRGKGQSEEQVHCDSAFHGSLLTNRLAPLILQQDI